MKQLVECVPNFSEGRDHAVIDAITAQIQSVAGATLLDVDPGEATNRTVVTLVGSPEAAVEAAFLAIRKAAELIDMRQHHGAHPRQGATDVCPFVPVSGITVEECVALAHRLARRVGEELHLPVYLYEAAASRPERRSLADIRVGEYEALAEKLTKPEWKPDYGPAEFNARAGATVIGVRPFLIAYNVNLNCREDRIAKQIGLTIRENGRAERDDQGQKRKNAAGEPVRIPGLPHCRATGWYIAEYGRAQVTMNLTDFHVTPIHVAFDRVEELAHQHGARVTGSEIVGLVPKEALLVAGRHYLGKQGRTTGLSEEELVQVARLSLGLDDVAPFDPEQKIIEHRVARPRNLAGMKVDAFVDLLASDAPAPGGGSVAALAASMAAGLCSMVAALTFGKKGYTEHNSLMEQVGTKAQALKDALLSAVDRDTEAFDRVMAGMRLPKATEEQKAERARAIEEATREATLVPLSVLERCPEVLELVAEVAGKGNQNSLSDAGVAGLMARAAAFGACYNVLINLRGIEDGAWRAAILGRAEAAVAHADDKGQRIQEDLLAKLRVCLAPITR
jgi:glutamate formiminotransferase/formiminotetrahydrofolate cyclodeaminase